MKTRAAIAYKIRCRKKMISIMNLMMLNDVYNELHPFNEWYVKLKVRFFVHVSFSTNIFLTHGFTKILT